MKRFFSAAKAAIVIVLSLLCVLFALLIASSPIFEKGEGYEFSLGESSSAVQLSTEHPLLFKILHKTRGESVRYEGDRYEELKEKYHAELLFSEEAGGVTNYYLYSPELGGGVELLGYRVNLHIAVRGERTAVGSPLIFGGL